ncbi:hypothetical protein L2Y96_12840 [Luteibacter aegosomaticola]|uniref:hypothetical protein n=1 Tax=Luteibacter aegosomaticola TaxID=2911538 RepID=UPI001FF9A88F|nr:hypothetical protein [Luteibacter aegosomaticola]UPG88307.1 hypothetical protein L2Y96_12840 [Luteibacter aegosomaticola]
MMHTRFHTALGRVHVPNMPSSQRLPARLGQVLGGALPTLCEAAAQGLPLGTLADVTTVWESQIHHHHQTAPEFPVAIFELLGLVRSMPFGADVLGAFLAVHWTDCALDPSELAEEGRVVKRALSLIPHGFYGELRFNEGRFGRLTLGLLAAIVQRGDVDLRALEVVVKCTPTDDGYPSIVCILASCFVHGHLPTAIEFVAGEESLCRLDCPCSDSPVLPTASGGLSMEAKEHASTLTASKGMVDLIFSRQGRRHESDPATTTL